MMIEHKEFEEIGRMQGECKVMFAYVGNVWVRLMHFAKAGERNIPHSHDHDHTTLLASGSVKVTVNGEESVFRAPCLIYVQKGHYHFLEALEDNTVASCVHGIRGDQGAGDILAPESVPAGIPIIEVPQRFGPFSTGPVTLDPNYAEQV